MKIKYYYCIFLIGYVILSSFVMQSERDIIEWSKDYKLTWNDFKGKIDETSKNNTFAMSAVGIEIDKFIFNKKIGKTKVRTIFDCNNSWTKTKNNEMGLIHEQGHFDITEIYARKLRKKLNNKLFKRDVAFKGLENIYNKIEQEKNNYQNLYDEQTKHHKNTEKQNEWDENIKKQLQELEKYNNPEITLRLW